MPQHDAESLVETIFQALQSHTPEVLGEMSLMQLDRTNTALNDMLRAVNITRNSKLLINTVIKDVLYRIFFMVVGSSKHPTRQALYLSHVCHYWRKLALRWPVLWTSMDLRYYNLSKLCIERNAMAPIDLLISDRPIPQFMSRYYAVPEWRRQHPLIPELVPRLRSLTLHIDDPSHSDDVLSYFQKNPVLLRLQSLDIHLPHLDENPVLVPDYFFNSAHPPRSLILHRVVLNWANPPVRSLTRLSLIAPTVPPTLQQLMTLMFSCPKMEELELKWIFPPVFPPSHPAATELSIDPSSFEFEGPIMELPHLWRLTIALVTSMCIPFFKSLIDHIHVPALKSLFLDSPYYDTAATATHPFNLLPNKPSYPFETLKHVHITQMQQPPGPCVLKGRISRDGHSIGLRDESNMDIFIRSPVPTTGPTNSEFLVGVMKSLRAVEHLELYVDAWSYLDAESGIDIFAAMPDLSTLEVSGEQTSVSNASAVWDSVASRGSDLPLTTLCLRHVRCEGAKLLRLVSETKIRKIHLDHCLGVDAQGVSELRDVGVMVHWSEEMSTEEMALLWGDSWSNYHGIWPLNQI